MDLGAVILKDVRTNLTELVLSGRDSAEAELAGVNGITDEAANPYPHTRFHYQTLKRAAELMRPLCIVHKRQRGLPLVFYQMSPGTREVTAFIGPVTVHLTIATDIKLCRLAETGSRVCHDPAETLTVSRDADTHKTLMYFISPTKAIQTRLRSNILHEMKLT